MATRLNPYLGFRDNARQAMEFYHSVFGGALTLNTFGELQASEDPAEHDKIMHAQLETEAGFLPDGGRYAELDGVQLRLEYLDLAQRR